MDSDSGSLSGSTGRYSHGYEFIELRILFSSLQHDEIGDDAARLRRYVESHIFGPEKYDRRAADQGRFRRRLVHHVSRKIASVFPGPDVQVVVKECYEKEGSWEVILLLLAIFVGGPAAYNSMRQGLDRISDDLKADGRLFGRADDTWTSCDLALQSVHCLQVGSP